MSSRLSRPVLTKLYVKSDLHAFVKRTGLRWIAGLAPEACRPQLVTRLLSTQACCRRHARNICDRSRSLMMALCPTVALYTERSYLI